MLLSISQFAVILSSILVFLLVIMALVLVLIIAKNKLIPSGDVTVSINHNERELIVRQGTNLLSALGENKIFLPSACGGKGSCGMCKCQVDSGAGTILPTETGFFTRKQRADNWRLACQVKLRENIEMRIPEEILGIKKWDCTVVSNRNVATFIKELVVRLPETEKLHFRSGGYIQVDVPACKVHYKDFEIGEKYRADWDKFHLFDLVMNNPEPTFRAYSMANHPAEDDIIMLNVRIASPPVDRVKGGFMKVNPGICSSYIYSLKPGDPITISGPFGEFFLKPTTHEKMFIGGGAGMAPMRSHLFHLFRTEKHQHKTTFWYGARSLREVFYMDEFLEIERNFPNFKFTLALSEPLAEDDWKGPTGFIHQVIYDLYLSKHPEPEEVEYYLCGPPQMNAAVQKMLADLGVPKENIAFDDFGG